MTSNYSILIWIAFILIISTIIAVYLGSKKPSSRAFCFSVLLVSLWVGVSGFYQLLHEAESVDFFVRMSYFLGGTIPASFIYFFYIFPEEKKPPDSLFVALLLLEVVFAFLFFFTNLIISGVYPLDGGQLWGWNFGPLSFLFEAFFFGFFGFGILLLLKKYKASNEAKMKRHLKHMLWVIIVGAIPPSLVSMVLPRFGYFSLDWIGPVSEIFWIPIIVYSVIRHNLFNAKIVIIELLIFVLWIMIFTRIFFADQLRNTLVEYSLLAITFIFSVLLIRYFLREIEHREKIKALTEELKKVYKHIGDLDSR